MADNLFAQYFERIDADTMKWPSTVKLRDLAADEHFFDEFRGKTVLMDFWTESCGPCLTELQPLAGLAKLKNSDRFQIVSVLSGSLQPYLEPAANLLQQRGASDLPLYMDTSHGRAADAFARKPGASVATLPCKVIFDPKGRAVGRMLGGEPVTVEGKMYSVWATNHAIALCDALGGGLFA